MTNATLKRTAGIRFVMPAVRIGHVGVMNPEVQRDLDLERSFEAFERGLVRAIEADPKAVKASRKAIQQVNLNELARADVTVNGFRSLI